jgi:enamine deaminase RidA (YjgF/YER057c/UK114 family)
MEPEERLRSLGLALPDPLPAQGSYVPVRSHGDRVLVSGQGPLLPAGGFVLGKVGAELSLDQGREAARLTALSALAVLAQALGRLRRIEAILRVVGYVNCAPGFEQMPAVIDGFSEVLVEVLGDAGRHARSAVGVAELPFGIPVEVELEAAVAA